VLRFVLELCAFAAIALAAAGQVVLAIVLGVTAVANGSVVRDL
jgi:hypothetical protein